MLTQVIIFTTKKSYPCEIEEGQEVKKKKNEIELASWNFQAGTMEITV